MRMHFTPVALSFACVLAIGCQATEPESLDIEFRPNIPPCPNCGIVIDDDDDEYVLLMEIDEEYASATVTDPALKVIDPSTQDPLTVSMAPMSVSTSGTTVVALSEYEFAENEEVVSDWLAANTSVTTAWLSLQVDEDGSGPNPPQTRISEIYVDHS